MQRTFVIVALLFVMQAAHAGDFDNPYVAPTGDLNGKEMIEKYLLTPDSSFRSAWGRLHPPVAKQIAAFINGPVHGCVF